MLLCVASALGPSLEVGLGDPKLLTQSWPLKGTIPTACTATPCLPQSFPWFYTWQKHSQATRWSYTSTNICCEQTPNRGFLPSTKCSCAHLALFPLGRPAVSHRTGFLRFRRVRARQTLWETLLWTKARKGDVVTDAKLPLKTRLERSRDAGSSKRTIFWRRASFLKTLKWICTNNSSCCRVCSFYTLYLSCLSCLQKPPERLLF